MTTKVMFIVVLATVILFANAGPMRRYISLHLVAGSL